MLYRPRHFQLAELVDPRILAERGEAAWNLLRPTSLMMLDALREKFGPLVVNGELNGHQYTESGLRLFDTPTGAKWSMHKFGGAYDVKPKACRPRDIYDYVLAHPDEFQHINAIEDIASTKTWVHFDDRNADRRILVVRP